MRCYFINVYTISRNKKSKTANSRRFFYLLFIIHILYYYIYLTLLLSYKLENKNLILTNIFQFVPVYMDSATIHVFYIDFC